jgi:hypothetical protein
MLSAKHMHFDAGARPSRASGNAWFALNKDEPLTFFAGLWRKGASVTVNHDGLRRTRLLWSPT